ncbi:uncharacterized protein LOC128674527 [Plodia interpunctella]|uniref:uncharacterized protein LOC128674527 n=1 Tax=Plodia interpunctella TaxID=58824 RepID=UPI002368922F|nr:uncharacterized protein LOC128674527 [Plodia interpunctella]
MPEEDVSDLRDVVDAINKLCETMKTSHYDDAETNEGAACEPEICKVYEESAIIPQHTTAISDQPEVAAYVYEEATIVPQYTEYYTDLISPGEISVQKVETYTDTVNPDELLVRRVDSYRDIVIPEESSDQKVESFRDLATPEEVPVQRVETYRAERWSDSQISLPGQTEDVETVTSDTEPAAAQCEPLSEMYYTASSEVSLLSDLELPDKAQIDNDSLPEKDSKDDRKECVIAGHVAAMRERFESMTRANTPCPDLMRSMSPSLDFRNITPSPDHLG